MNNYIADIYPSKAQFMKAEPVEIELELENPSGSVKIFELEIRTMLLNRMDGTWKYGVVLQPDERVASRFLLKPYDADFLGFGVDVSLFEQGGLVEEASTSFDVVSDWRKTPRYSFLCDFSSADKGDSADVRTMRKYHMNLVQFYDWMYRHDHLIPPQDAFQDLMGRPLDFGAVREKVALCHQYGMRAMAYGAVYAASNAFYGEHPDWALTTSAGEAFGFIGIFKIMDISRASPWHAHIIGQYREAVREAGFDGIHMDAYGYPKTAISRRDGKEEIILLDEHFPTLIDDTREALTKEKGDVCLIFNNVGNWPMDATAKASQDAVYVEVWPPYERYWHIQGIIQRAKDAGCGKPVILAAYAKAFLDTENEGYVKALYSLLLLLSATAANGAYNLLFGEENGILTQAYYVNYHRIDTNHSRIIRRYCDFLVRYSGALFDAGLKDVSMTHMLGDNREYIFDGFECSAYAEPGKIWTIIRESRTLKCVSFINLRGNGDIWNEGKNEPEPQEDMQIRIAVDRLPASVFTASPDWNAGKPSDVRFTAHISDRGYYILVRLGKLFVWNLLVIQFCDIHPKTAATEQ